MGYRRMRMWSVVALLALVCFWPAAAWAQFYVRLPIEIRDSSGQVVPGVRVFAWERTGDTSWPSMIHGITGDDGRVLLDLTLWRSVNNLDHPAPNIGLLAVPPDVIATSAALTSPRPGFAVASMAFFYPATDPNNPAQANLQTIQLPTANILQIQVRDEAGNAVSFGGNIFINSVPPGVFTFPIDAPAVYIAWAPGVGGSVTAYGDMRQNDLSASEYFLDNSSPFMVNADPTVHTVTLPRRTKIAVTGTPNLPTGVSLPEGGYYGLWLRKFEWWNEQPRPRTVTNLFSVGNHFTSSPTFQIFVEPGKYLLTVTAYENEGVGSFSAPLMGVDPTTVGFEVVQSPVTVNPALRPARMVELTLKTQDGAVVPNYSSIGLYRKFLIGGVLYWAKLWDRSVDSAGKLLDWLEPGEYFFATQNSAQLPGFIQQMGTTWRSYFDVKQGIDVVITDTDQTVTMTMPRAGGLQGKALLAGASPVPLPYLPGGFSPAIFGAVARPENQFFPAIPYVQYNPSTGEYFVGFLPAGTEVVRRFDYQDANNFDKVYQKILPPVVVANADTTVVDDVIIDPASFVRVSGTVYLGAPPAAGGPLPPVVNQGRVYLQHVLANVKWNTIAWHDWRDLQSDSLLPDAAGAGTYGFWVERGMNYLLRLEPAQMYPPYPLAGAYLPGEFALSVPANSGPITKDLYANPGVALSGKIYYGADVYPNTVLMTVYRQEFPWERRQGVVASTGFMLTGLGSGTWVIEVDLENLPNRAYPPFAQTQPLIVRKVTIEENEGEIPFDIVINPAQIGSIQGSLVDSTGQPVEGALLALVNREGQPVFYFTTDASGTFIRPTNASYPELIWAEAGDDYRVNLQGVLPGPGSSTATVDYTFDVIAFNARAVPFAITGGRITPLRLVVPRAYALTARFTQNGQPIPYQGWIPLANVSNPSAPWNGMAPTSEPGLWQAAGLPGGTWRAYFQVQPAGGLIHLVSHDFTMPANQSLRLEVDLASLTFRDLTVRSKLGADPLYNVGFLLEQFLTADPNGPRLHLGYFETDDAGNFLAKLTPGRYQVIPIPMDVSDPGNPPVHIIPQAPVVVDLTTSNQDIVLTWTEPISFEVKITNPPSGGLNGKFVARLFRPPAFGVDSPAIVMPFWDPAVASFPAGDTFFPHEGPVDGINYLAITNDTGAVIQNVRPGDEYRVAIYELMVPVASLTPGEPLDPHIGQLRLLSAPFAIATAPVNQRREFVLPPMADLVVSVRDATNRPVDGAVVIEYTLDPAATLGMLAESIIPGGDDVVLENGLATFSVPASRTYRIWYLPPPGQPIMPRVDDNVLVTAAGRQYSMAVQVQSSLVGQLKDEAGAARAGLLYLVPEGADFQNTPPFTAPTADGDYRVFMPAGWYIGYAIPATSTLAATQVRVGVTASQTARDFVMKAPRVLEISLQSFNESGIFTVLGGRLEIFRKPSDASSLTDGQPLLPYPAVNNRNSLLPNALGTYTIPVEPGVDYYVVPIVSGFQTPAPIRVAKDDPVRMVIPLTPIELLTLSGSVNVPAAIEARPLTQNALGAAIPTYHGATDDIASGGRYWFSLQVDPRTSYQLVVIPRDPTYARKVFEPPYPAEFDLTQGFTISGRLRDLNGNEVKAAGVGVNLATMRNGLSFGYGTVTDANGVFSFTQIPRLEGLDFAFLQTTSGATFNGVRYGLGRTPNFQVTSNLTQDIMVIPAGTLVGSVVDTNGLPVLAGQVVVRRADVEVRGVVATGAFRIDNLAPAPDYLVAIDGIPGRPPMSRANVAIQPGQVTNLGTFLVPAGLSVEGRLSKFRELVAALFPQGLRTGTTLQMIGLRSGEPLNELDLLTDRALGRITGRIDLIWDAANVASIPEPQPFRGLLPGGNTDFAGMIQEAAADGSQWRTTFAWQLGVPLPDGAITTDTFQIPAQTATTSWGSLVGTLSHTLRTDLAFNPGDAVVYLFPFDTAQNRAVITPLPAAMAIPVNGRYRIGALPNGTYKMYVLGRMFPRYEVPGTVVVNGATTQNIAITEAACRLFGRITDTAGNGLPDARVVLNDNLVTMTLATGTPEQIGTYEFFVASQSGFIAKVWAGKAGYAPKRVITTLGVVNGGESKNLGAIDLSAEVADLEGTVVEAADSSKPVIGAKVRALVREVADGPFTLVAETTTDPSGRFKFIGLPANKVLTLQAVAERFKPSLRVEFSLAPQVSETLDQPVKLEAMPQTATFDGRVENNQLQARCWFVLPSTPESVKFSVDGNEVTSGVAFPDLANGKFTLASFSVDIDPTQAHSVVVTENAAVVGSFVVEAQVVQKQKVLVDPLAPGGFEFRAERPDGGQSAAGIKVPEGFLPPEVGSFTFAERAATGTVNLGGTGQVATATLAGPVFDLSFGGLNLGVTSGNVTENLKKFLFEVTIRYFGSQWKASSFEPRWFDTQTKTWSKVGIDPASIRPDHPEKGYVTFKVTHLTEFAVVDVPEAANNTVPTNPTNPSDSTSPTTTPTSGSGGGYVSDDGGGGSRFCFIWTATYGSPMHPKVLMFRRFRDQYLLTNAPGRWFTQTYYRVSPPIAQYIAQREWLRTTVRVLLLPITWMVELLFAVGGKMFLLLLALALLSGTVAVRRWRRRSTAAV